MAQMAAGSRLAIKCAGACGTGIYCLEYGGLGTKYDIATPEVQRRTLHTRGAIRRASGTEVRHVAGVATRHTKHV